jgi:uncharacterized protein (TIGR03067 family)
MRVLAVLLAVALAAADPPKDKSEGAPKELQGTWVVGNGANSEGRAITGGSATLTLNGDKAEWTEIILVSEKAGKGTVTVDTSRKPPTIELKAGDTTIKGIYRFPFKDKKDVIEFLFSASGKDFPTEFGERPLQFPKGTKGLVSILGDRKKD